MSKYKKRSRNNYKNKKKYWELSFDEKVELYLEEAKKNRQILQKWRVRQLKQKVYIR